MHTTLSFIADARDNGISNFYVADYALVKKFPNRFRHNRLGAIPKDISKEGAGVKVRAFGFDEIGNVVALCADGKTRQFLGN